MEEIDDREVLDEIKETQEQSKKDFKTKLNQRKLSKQDMDELFG